ncbi:MAG: zinc ABC transporter substrate-binding protein [Bdellovibrionales bacterium]|jgi:zinc/manganese transport system substrate-binding protein
MRFPLSLCLLAIVLVTTPAGASPQPLKVVASFSLLGDMIQQVGGEAVTVNTLVGPDQDAHTFDPTPDAVKLIANADIIAISGLGFEPWMNKLIKASGTKAKLLVASAGASPRHMEGEGDIDPHAWQDLRNGALYVRNIYGALSAARPDDAATMKERARVYRDELLALDQETRNAFAVLAPERRKLLTSHDAFGYFAKAYGLQILAPMGISTDAQPSASTLAALTDQIKSEGVKTFYIENMTDPRLTQQLAKDTGARMGGTLYADALSAPDGDAPTYLAMMKSNIKKILEGM